MSSTPPGSERSARRSYDSPRRREQALETRTRIAEAARGLFVANGWAATHVRDVAREAGVAEPTVYAAYGSKAGLAMALVDALDTSADVPRLLAELDAAGDDPVRQLAAMVGFDRRLFERGGDVIALLRDAGSSEPKLGAAYQEGRGRGDQTRRHVFSGWSAATFRERVNAKSAADTFAALCNVDVYRVLKDERGWSPDQIERWWHESLVRLLLR